MLMRYDKNKSRFTFKAENPDDHATLNHLFWRLDSNKDNNVIVVYDGSKMDITPIDTITPNEPAQ